MEFQQRVGHLVLCSSGPYGWVQMESHSRCPHCPWGAGYKMLVIPVNRKLQIDVSHARTHIFSVFIFVLIRTEPWVPSPRMIFLMQSVLLLL